MNVFRRNKSGTSSVRSQRKNNIQDTKINGTLNASKDSTRADDGKIRYSEEETNSTQVSKGRRPRRHTTGGSQHKDAIQKAKDMVANDPSLDQSTDSNYGTLNRKELISMLKDRYGNDMEKYRSLKKNQTVDVEHRTVESNTLQRPKKSGKILSYKTSSEQNGHIRRGSTSSQEGSQTSQESIPYSATPPSFDSHSSKAMQTAALRQYAQRNRKISNGSSVQSGYSSSSEVHHMAPPVLERTHQTVTTKRRVVTQKSNEQQQRQQSFDEQQPQRMHDLAQLNREQQVLMSERQDTAHYQQQQQPTKQEDRDRVIYLQFNDEIKRVNMPSLISSLDTLKALFVTSFPGKLSMVRLDERGLIYIKDKEADLFYELEDIRDVKPRSHIQLREKSTSFESLASSHTDMSAFDRKYTNNVAYNAATLPSHGRIHRNDHYAESLQDFEVRPRSGSGSSLRSDSVLTKPTWHDNYQQPRQQKSAYANNGLLSPRLQKRQIQTVKTETTRYDTRAEGPQKVLEHEIGKPFAPLSEAPKLKTRMPSEKDKKGPTVEEQLSDLTKLLHTALNSDEEDGAHVEQPIPGKLDRNLMDNLEALSEDNYSKSPTKGIYYTPTALLAAKKRQIEGSPEDGDHFNFNTGTYTKTVVSKQMPASQPSMDNPDKGYMHDGPDVYMRSGNSKNNYESGVADSILQSLRAGEGQTATGQQTKTTSRTATTIRITSGSENKSQNMNHQSDATGKDTQTRSPPPTPTKTKSSQIAAQAIKATISPTHEVKHWTATAKVVTQPGQYKMDRQISIASSAAALRSSVLTLRSQIDELKLLQTSQTRNFKSFMSQSLQEFNALASTVSQNVRDSKESGHSIRDRRFRVQEDHDSYIKRMQNVSSQLSRLEDETEKMRRGIVQRKQSLNSVQLNRLNRDLESLGKYLAELKSRFSGLHDMLKIVMAGELEIIVSEERFLKDEPGNLDNLFARCKHLSGTIFALQRLASAQQLANAENEQQDVNQNRVHINAHSSEDGSAEDVRHRVTRTVRFTSNEHSGFL